MTALIASYCWPQAFDLGLHPKRVVAAEALDFLACITAVAIGILGLPCQLELPLVVSGVLVIGGGIGLIVELIRCHCFLHASVTGDQWSWREWRWVSLEERCGINS